SQRRDRSGRLTSKAAIAAVRPVSQLPVRGITNFASCKECTMLSRVPKKLASKAMIAVAKALHSSARSQGLRSGWTGWRPSESFEIRASVSDMSFLAQEHAQPLDGAVHRDLQGGFRLTRFGRGLLQRHFLQSQQFHGLALAGRQLGDGGMQL